MAGIAAGHAVTPNRRSHIKFDVDDQVLLQPPYSLIRMGPEICKGPDAQISFVRYLQNVGWELEPYQANLSFKTEREEAAGGTLLGSNGGLTIPGGFVEVPFFAKPTDLNGSSGAWYDPNVTDQGDVFIQKRIGDEDSFEQRLSADQTSYPSAADENGENVAMDRIARSVENHNQAPLIFSFVAPTKGSSVPHKLKTLHFNGPAGSGKKWKGSGRYQLDFLGDGKCILRELVRFQGESTDEWMPQHTFQYAPAYSVGGQAHRVEIRPIPAGHLATAPYGAIVFDVKVDRRASYSSGPGLLQAGTSKATSLTSQSTYVLTRTLARTSEDPPATTSVPVRIDSRRDQRIPFQISKLVYREEGYLIDAPFALDFWPMANLTLKVYGLGWVPGGTTLTARLFDANDDSEIAVVTASGLRFDFTVPERTRYFYVRWDFTGTADATPILEGYQVVMDQFIDTVQPGEFEPEASGAIPYALETVSITGAESDPSHESMRLRLEDTADSLDRLSVRGRMLAELSVEWDPEDEANQCKLFRGYMVDNSQTAKGHGTETGKFPDRNWKSYDLTFLGVWKRLSEGLSSVRFDWHGPDPTAPVGVDGVQPPYKATDAIRTMLGWAGFPSSMIDIDDNEIRLYPSTTNDLFIEPLANLCDYIVRIAKDYLAMYLTFDPNAGTYGKWRLLSVPIAPFTNVAAFVDTGPENKLAHSLDSYPTDPPTAFICKDTLKTGTRPLEANRLVVTGTGILAGAPPDLVLLTQVLYNFRSANWFGLDEAHPNYPDPDHPDWVGYDLPLYIVDPTLQTPEAVNLVSRRVFDIACLSTRQLHFMAPLLLIDHETEEGKKRPLRFGDPVTVERFGVESQWLVRNVNPVYEKDHVQLAAYELEAPREPFLAP